MLLATDSNPSGICIVIYDCFPLHLLHNLLFRFFDIKTLLNCNLYTFFQETVCVLILSALFIEKIRALTLFSGIYIGISPGSFF